MTSTRYALAAIASGMAAWLPVFLLGAFILATDTGLDRAGHIDNAPGRAAVLLMYVTPGAAALFACVFSLVAGILRWLGRNSLGGFLGASVLLALCIAIPFGFQGFALGGLQEAAISYAIFCVAAFICLCCGSIAWHCCVSQKHAQQGAAADGSAAAEL